jgi:hypothetical protein
LREDAGGDTPGEQRAGIWYGHARAPNLVSGRGLARPDGAGSIGAGRHCLQSIVSLGCPSFVHGGDVATLYPTAECTEVI